MGRVAAGVVSGVGAAGLGDATEEAEVTSRVGREAAEGLVHEEVHASLAVVRMASW